jgi:predicted alpha/beta-hydrolase family hydrolase
MRELRLPSADTSASLHGRGHTVVVLGHGAGGDRRTPMLVELAEAIAASGRAALLYNFPYAERGARRPDPPRVLESTAREAAEVAAARAGAGSVVWGGRSMGGRIASQVVAAGAPCAALTFLAYPLHPPGRPDKRPCCSSRAPATPSPARTCSTPSSNGSARGPSCTRWRAPTTRSGS